MTSLFVQMFMKCLTCASIRPNCTRKRYYEFVKAKQSKLISEVNTEVNTIVNTIVIDILYFKSLVNTRQIILN